MAASDKPDVPPIPVPPIEPAPKAQAAPAKPAAVKPATTKPAATKPAATKPTATKPAAKASTSTTAAAPASAPVADRPNPYAQAAPAAPQPYMNGPYVAPPSQGLSITSMVLGIAGVLISFCYGFGFLFSVAAVITGHLATKREPQASAKGFRLAGIITGYVGLGIVLLWVIGFVVFFLILAGTSAGSYGYFN